MSETFFLINSKIEKLEELFAPGSAPSSEPSTTSSTTFFAAKYLENDLQYILKTVLEAKTSLIIIISPKGQWKRLLKASFPDIY